MKDLVIGFEMLTLEENGSRSQAGSSSQSR